MRHRTCGPVATAIKVSRLLPWAPESSHKTSLWPGPLICEDSSVEDGEEGEPQRVVFTLQDLRMPSNGLKPSASPLLSA